MMGLFWTIVFGYVVGRITLAIIYGIFIIPGRDKSELLLEEILEELKKITKKGVRR